MTKQKVLCPLFGLNIQHPYHYKTKRSHSQIKKDYDDIENQLRNGIELVDGIIIRRMSNEDIKLLQSRPHASFTPPFNLSTSMFLLEKIVKDLDFPLFESSKTLFNIVLALRLLKAGYVSGSEAIYFIAKEKDDYQFSGSDFSESPRRREHIVNYPLNFDDFVPLKKVIQRIQQAKIKERKHFHLAIKRFERIYETTNIDDKLIDLMIAYEILFLKGERASPKGVAIGIGCSMLLGKTDNEREEIRQDLSKAYKIRNDIVHEGLYKEKIVVADKEYSIYELVGKVEDYLREAIKKLL